MKKISLLLLIVFCLAACGGGGDSGDSNSNTRELAMDETVTDKIDNEGEVHMYHLVADPNGDSRVLTASLTGTHNDSPVDFMLTIYEKDADGNLNTLFGASAKEGVIGKAGIDIKVPVDKERHLYLAVRDFMDDDANDKVFYRLTAAFTDETVDNDSFEEAIDITLEDGPVCNEDEAINEDSDEDYFRFTVGGANPAGVYRISAQFDINDNTSMPVNLDLELYNSTGQLIQEYDGAKPTDYLYVLLPYLEDGTYFLMVADQGRNASSGTSYKLCIEPVAADEVKLNDTSDTADDNLDMQPKGDNLVGCTINGSLEYIQDVDWYELNVTPAPDMEKNIVINLAPNFDGGQVPDQLKQQTKPAKYWVSVLDENFNVVYSFEHSVLALNSNIVEIGAGPGSINYVTVKPSYNAHMLMAMPYQMTIDLRDASDEFESAESIELTEGVAQPGKIFKIGDTDAYHIENASSTPQILEVFFETEDNAAKPSDVNYVVTVQWGGTTRTLTEVPGLESNRVLLKSSYYVTEPGTVSFTVGDNQNNDGSDLEYRITANFLDIPGSVAGGDHYQGEVAERNDDTGNTLTVIEYDATIQPQHKANTSLLRVPAIASGGSHTFQWITGFADYSGDRDIFELNFDDAIPADQNAEYYFDISIQMTAAGSPVEYAWTLFRDRDPERNVIVDRTFWTTEPGSGNEYEFNDNGEGIVASWADDDLASNAIDRTVPSGDDGDFWLGSRWRGSKFYISVNDFNYTNDPEDRDPPLTLNPIPDNDWGNTNSSVAPYRIQVTVTYHEGCPSPTECN